MRIPSTLVVAAAIVLAGCYPQGAPPLPGVQLSVPFHWQEQELYCGEANIQMWEHFIWQRAESQQDILNFVQTFYPFEVGYDGSLSPHGIAVAANWFVGGGISEQYYTGANKRIAIADQKKGISRSTPTIVLTEQGFHSVTLKGAYWHQLSDLQPSADYMYYHDPRDGRDVSTTVGEWMNFKGTGCYGYDCIVNIERGDQYGSAQAELDEFDYWGGTYYGDPVPPDGCPECPPIMAHLHRPLTTVLQRIAKAIFEPPATRMIRARPYSQVTQPTARTPRVKPVGPGQGKGVRREIFVPHPGSVSTNDIIENFRAGVQQTKMALIPGWEDVDLRSGRVAVSSVEPVVSLGNHPDFYLLTLSWIATAQRYGLATVNHEGWLMSVTVDASGSFQSPFTADEAASLVADRLNRTPRRTGRVYADGSASLIASEFHPFWQVDTDAGPAYVDERGDVFVPDPTGKGLLAGKGGLQRVRRVGP
jgi:hypothetical protein